MQHSSRIIKKYPNRRLYDTQVGTYITLGDIKKLVVDHIDFEVIDVKTQKNLTQATLLQVIAEQESTTTPIFSSIILQNFIRFYHEKSQHIVSQYLEQALLLFMQQKDFFKNQWTSYQEMLSQPALVEKLFKIPFIFPANNTRVKKNKKAKINMPTSRILLIIGIVYSFYETITDPKNLKLDLTFPYKYLNLYKYVAVQQFIIYMEAFMYSEGFQQWLKMNKYLSSPLTDWNKTFTSMCQRLTQHQLDLISDNFSRMSDQLKRLSEIKKPEDYLPLQKEMINEDISATIENMHSFLREFMSQLEELMKLFTTFNETATNLSKNIHKDIHGKTEKERTGN